MADWKIWLIIIILIFGYAVYNPNSPLKQEQQTSIQASIPDLIDNIFTSVFNPGEKQANASLNNPVKLGKIDCSTDAQCQSSYPSYTNAACGADGNCYSGG